MPVPHLLHQTLHAFMVDGLRHRIAQRGSDSPISEATLVLVVHGADPGLHDACLLGQFGSLGLGVKRAARHAADLE